MKKFIAMLLSACLTFCLVSITAVAAPVAPAFATPPQSFVDSTGTIHESVYIAEDNATLERQVQPNGETMVTVTQNGQTTVQYGRISVAQYQALKYAISLQSASTRASVDVHDYTVFNHDWLAFGSATIYVKEISLTAAAIAAVIASQCGINVAAAASFAYGIADYIQGAPAVNYVEVETDTYIVSFIENDQYFCYCYHEVARYYGLYDNYLNTETSIYQIVGG